MFQLVIRAFVGQVRNLACGLVHPTNLAGDLREKRCLRQAQAAVACRGCLPGLPELVEGSPDFAALVPPQWGIQAKKQPANVLINMSES